MKQHRTLSQRVDEQTVATALVSFALFGVLAFVLICYFFAPG